MSADLPELETCYCGHTRGEHEDHLNDCMIEGCDCVMFEHDPEADDE
jgi:hypothetical protein